VTPRRVPWLVVGLAVAVWVVLQFGWYADAVITDIPVYREAGEAMLDGRVPYRDFSLEYPPLAAALFALVALVPLPFAGVFSVVMLLCLIATALSALAIARELDLGAGRQLLAGAAVAVSPLLIGNLVESRFDLFLAALMGWMVWAMVAGRWQLAWTLFGLATLAKLIPLVLAPVLVLFQRHREGIARALAGLAGGVGLAAAGVLPFLVASPGGTWDIARYHLERPLQIESIGAAYLILLDKLADIGLAVENSYGSQGLAGEGPQAIAAISSAILVVLVAAVAITLALALRRSRAPGDARLLVAAVAATLAAGLAAGKVLSPQFLLWLMPCALLVAGRHGRVALGIALAAFLATGIYFPHRYWDLVAFEPLPVVLLLIRDALLVALVAACWPRPHIGERGEAGPLGRPSAAGAGRAERAVAARYLTD
jgi:hypothetical protein